MNNFRLCYSSRHLSSDGITRYKFETTENFGNHKMLAESTEENGFPRVVRDHALF